jgi:uncharacterized protein (UPF0303 family)
MSVELELSEQIADIKAQEERLVFASFSHSDAWRLGGVIMELATSRGLGIAWDVSRGEQIVAHGATEGSNAANDLWIARKIRLAKLTNSSTLRVRLEAQASGRNPSDWLEPFQYAVAGGCFPIRVAGGAVVGTATVSGLPDTADHSLVVEAIEAYLAS